jgi:hypothetical protein
MLQNDRQGDAPLLLGMQLTLKSLDANRLRIARERNGCLARDPTLFADMSPLTGSLGVAR